MKAVINRGLIPADRPALKHFVTPTELEELRNALSQKEVPTDLNSKLARLAQGDLLQRFVAHNSRTLIALLQAAQQGAFQGASPADCERLLRVLAYVRKDDDAIPDYRRDGFVDDQKEVRAALAELAGLVQAFKSWYLRHQVPSLWHAGVASSLSRVGNKVTRADSLAVGSV